MKLKQLFFILFSLFTLHFSLQAREPLPLLVEGGEPFTHRADYYIPKRSVVNAVIFSPDGKAGNIMDVETHSMKWSRVSLFFM